MQLPTNFTSIIYVIPLVFIIVIIYRSYVIGNQFNKYIASITLLFYMIILELLQDSTSLTLISACIIGMIPLVIKIFRLKNKNGWLVSPHAFLNWATPELNCREKKGNLMDSLFSFINRNQPTWVYILYIP